MGESSMDVLMEIVFLYYIWCKINILKVIYIGKMIRFSNIIVNILYEVRGDEIILYEVWIE